MTRALIACRQMQDCFERFAPRLESLGIECVLPTVVQQLEEPELLTMIGEFEGMIAGDDHLTGAVLARATRLKIVSKWGIGTDSIDLAAAERLGIKVMNTPAVFGDDVADVAAGYLVLVARRLHLIDRSVRDGGWLKHRGIRLADRTLGIYGLGSIGRTVARRGQGFGMRVVGYDIAAGSATLAADAGIETVARPEQLFAESDFLVLCAPATPETDHVVCADSLAQMRAGSFLINVSRGSLVDEAALADALEAGRLAGAALDVFESEPLPKASRLRALDGCIFGSHNASNTEQGVLRASELAVQNLIDGLSDATDGGGLAA
jgi:D-3-phosphoglycerate dehydrogenase / 2-oxoglutarate reductase